MENTPRNFFSIKIYYLMTRMENWAGQTAKLPTNRTKLLPESQITGDFDRLICCRLIRATVSTPGILGKAQM
ncbi:hypothetical protein GCM10007052_09130 [Halioglobus japonicus]|nr:hypothetical protein GCM10007052_09130 [Halioglobus japonicus]